jgi:hypothetical protein
VKASEYNNELSNPVEKKLFDDSQALFSAILDDLKSRHLLRTVFIPLDSDRLLKIWENSALFGSAYNEMIERMGEEESAKFIKDTELAPNTVGFIFFSQMVATALYDYEAALKTTFLFFLEEEQGNKNGLRSKMTLGQLIRRLKEISPSFGEALVKLIDLDLRNSLAHGTFWFDRGKVFLAQNSYLDEIQAIPLVEFWKKTRRINIISHAFIKVLMKKLKEGYFKL